MKAIMETRLRIQCENDIDHAKILPIESFVTLAPKLNPRADREVRLYFARRIGEIICGNSNTFIYKPNGGSPIGFCRLCGGKLSYEVQEWEQPK